MILLTLLTALFYQAQQPVPAADLGFIAGAGLTASTPTQYLVSFFKRGLPAAPSWAVMLAAICAAQLATFLISKAMGEVFTGQVVAKTILAGIFATAAAAGANESGRSADAQRDRAKAAQDDGGDTAG